MSDNNQDNQQTPNTELPAGAASEEKVNQETPKEEGQAPEQGKKPEEGKEKQEQPEKPKKDRLNRRFSELTAHKRAAQAEAQSVRELIRDVTGEEPPKPSDFKTQAEYDDAMADLRQKLASYKAMEKKAERTINNIDQEYMETLGQGWQDKVTEVSTSIKDWQAVVSAARVPLTPELTMAIMESDVGPQIAYHLAKNPEEAYEIAGLSPIGQARRIGQLESKIQSGGMKPPEIPVSQAKPPVAPVLGDGAKPKPNLGNNMTLEEYRRARGLIK